MLRINGNPIISQETLQQYEFMTSAGLTERFKMYFSEGLQQQGMVWVLEEEVILGYELLAFSLLCKKKIEVDVDGFKLSIDKCIRLFPEFVGPFAWNWDGGYIADLQSGSDDVSIRDILLSPSLVEELRIHHDIFENCYRIEPDWKAFHEEGRRLGKLVKSELGIYYHVIYEKPVEDPSCYEEDTYTELRIFESGYVERKPLPCAFYSNLEEIDAATAFTKAWNNRDLNLFTGFLCSNLSNLRPNGLENLNGKDRIVSFLAEKLRAVKRMEISDPQFMAGAALATTLKDGEERPCVCLTQGDEKSVILFDMEYDTIRVIHMCEPEYLEICGVGNYGD